MNRILLSGFVMAAMASTATAQIIELTAIDSKSISDTHENWNDNRFRAYWSNRHVDGFVKFDFSGIPDGAQIMSMSLRTFHEEGFGNPANDPQVRLYRVANDSWARTQSDSHPGLNEVLTPVHNGFPFGNLVPWDWDIDVSAADWSQDLADDRLSICMRNVQTSYSYVYWYGSDPNPAPPVLTVEYRTGGFTIRLTGQCPGQKTLAWDGAGSGQMGIIIGNSQGTTTIPSGHCEGTQLGIQGSVTLYNIIGTQGGSGQVSQSIGSGGRCGRWIQCIKINDCALSNVAGPI